MPNGQKYETSLLQKRLDEFEPAFYFEVGEEYCESYGPGPVTPDKVFITPEVVSISTASPEGGQLLFTNPLHVFDLSNPREAKELPEPENAAEWVSWFQRHPNLDTWKPDPVRVGSASRKQIDVSYNNTSENYPRGVCGGLPCVPLYPLSDESVSAVYEGLKNRFVIVDVGGQTVVIDVAAPTDNFDGFLPKAQKVLDTVEWKGG
jgi:hypothetical protein